MQACERRERASLVERLRPCSLACEAVSSGSIPAARDAGRTALSNSQAIQHGWGREWMRTTGSGANLAGAEILFPGSSRSSSSNHNWICIPCTRFNSNAGLDWQPRRLARLYVRGSGYVSSRVQRQAVRPALKTVSGTEYLEVVGNERLA
jgi:hypothetical protein